MKRTKQLQKLLELNNNLRHDYEVEFLKKEQETTIIEITDNEENIFNDLLEDYGFVYFITDGEYVKIGIAKNIQRRLEQLQVGNPKKLFVYGQIGTVDYKILEQKLHLDLKKWNIRGEWFIFNDNVKNIIDYLLRL